MKKFINPLLRLGTAVALLSVIYMQNNELKELKLKVEESKTVITPSSINNIQDSLEAEIFNLQNINGRYELSLEHLYEVNPKAGKVFSDFMEHETE